MYHCHLRIHFAGPPCGAFDVIRGMPPLERFTHAFSQGESLEEAPEAELVVANLSACTPEGAAAALSALGKKGARLIALAPRGLDGLLDEAPPVLDDLWEADISGAGARFRFSRWQRARGTDTELWCQRQYLDAAINSTPDMIWFKDKNGIHWKVNDSFCRTVHKPREQVEGRDHCDIWGVDPNDPGHQGIACGESEREVMEKRRTCAFEETVKSGDGLRLLSTYKSPLFDLDGSVMGTVGVGSDCTEQKLQEWENRRRQEDLIQALGIDFSLVCFFDLDTGRGFPLRVNGGEGVIDPTQNGAASFEESLERYVREQVFDSDRDRVRAAASRQRLLDELAEKPSYFLNFQAAINDELKYYQMKAVRAGNWGRGHGVVVGFRSVDEETREEMEQKKLLENALFQAKQANEAKNGFLANMSREIRAPLGEIFRASRQLLDQSLPDGAREYAQAVQSSSQGLMNNIGNILDFSEIESGRLSVVPAEYDFAAMVREVMGMMEQRIKDKPVRLVTAIQDDIPRRLCGDAGRLRQILINLMGNAEKFTHEGAIMLSMGWEPLEEGYIWLKATVMDTGIGIRKEDQDKLFTAFEPLGAGENQGALGTGLGLPIAKLLVERMGGTMEVESEFGKGSSFTFAVLQEVLDPAPCEYNVRFGH